jgi:hypothetical protein
LHLRWRPESFNNGISDCDNTLASVNKDGKKYNTFLDQFILNEAKKEGRKRKLEEQQKEAAARDSNFTALTNYTRIAASSGSLAKHNIFEIGAGLLAKVKEKDDTEKRKKARISMKTNERERKNSERFQQAFAKLRSGRLLTREDLVALINWTKIATDGANGKNMKELSLQWEERKHRLNDYIVNDEIVCQTELTHVHVPFVGNQLSEEMIQTEEVAIEFSI